MSRFRLLRHLLATTGGGGGGSPLIYDTRFGTDSSTTIIANRGFFTFGLNSGARQVWLDSINGLDANSGLSSGAPKQTFDAAFALWTGAGNTGLGDQLMIAGKSSRTYTDNKLANMGTKTGYSLAYPMAVLSYDPTDPTNAAKYGKLTGPDLPNIKVAGTSSSIQWVGDNTTTNYLAVQGIELEAVTPGLGTSVGSVYRHNGQAYQNCRFKEVTLGIDSAGSANGLATTINVSHCSFWGMWAGSSASSPGNCQGAYLGGLDGPYIQDNVFAHCGWKIGAATTDAAGIGGPTEFSHAHYFHATGTNGRFDRNVYIDSAHDGLNVRGDGACSAIVTIGGSLGCTIGGFSASYTERPSGVTITVDDMLITGLEDHGIAADGCGCYTTNTLAGSYLNNVAMIDNPIRSGGNSVVLPHRDDTNQINQHLLMKNIRAYNFAGGLETNGGGFNAGIFDTWQDSIVDSLSFQTPNIVLNNTRAAIGGDFPGYQTADQLITTALTSMGLTPAGTATLRKNQMVNAMAWRPDLSWAAPFITIGLPTVGLTPLTPSTAFPNVSADTPRTIY